MSEASSIEKAIETVYCSICQKPMILVEFPNAVKNWYECNNSEHSVIVYLSEDERRIGKEEFATKIEKLRLQPQVFGAGFYNKAINDILKILLEG